MMLISTVSPVCFWLVVLIACLIIEAVTTQVVTLWFAAGSIGALLAANAGLSWAGQFGIFLVLSFVLLLLLRPLLRGVLRPQRDRTNADRILGQEAVVVQAIDNRNGTGQIRLMGQIWTARSIHNEQIAEGETVVVREISGVKAMVEHCDENGGNGSWYL